MNGRHFRPPSALLLATLLAVALARPARAQVPINIRTADNVTNDRPQIDAEIAAQVAKLAGGEVTAAREALIQDVGPIRDGVSTASSAYLEAFADSLNKQLQPLAQNPDLSVRLNAAITAARVSEYAGTPKLADTLALFAKDKSDAVVLWGLRGGKWVIPLLLRPPFANPNHALIQAIVPAVQAHSEGVCAGAIASDAYGALALDITNAARRKNITPEVIKGTIDPIQTLLATRLAMYQKGVPPQPLAETRGTGYLTNGAIWSVQTPPQQVKTMQLLSDLLALAAQQTKAVADRTELVLTIIQSAKALSVAASAAGEPGITQAVTPLTVLKPNTQPDEIIRLVAPIYPAIKGVTKFAGVTPPPSVQPGAAPATAPSGSTAAAPAIGAVK